VLDKLLIVSATGHAYFSLNQRNLQARQVTFAVSLQAPPVSSDSLSRFSLHCCCLQGVRLSNVVADHAATGS